MEQFKGTSSDALELVEKVDFYSRIDGELKRVHHPLSKEPTVSGEIKPSLRMWSRFIANRLLFTEPKPVKVKPKVIAPPPPPPPEPRLVKAKVAKVKGDEVSESQVQTVIGHAPARRKNKRSTVLNANNVKTRVERQRLYKLKTYNKKYSNNFGIVHNVNNERIYIDIECCDPVQRMGDGYYALIVRNDMVLWEYCRLYGTFNQTDSLILDHKSGFILSCISVTKTDGKLEIRNLAKGLQETTVRKLMAEGRLYVIIKSGEL